MVSKVNSPYRIKKAYQKMRQLLKRNSKIRVEFVQVYSCGLTGNIELLGDKRRRIITNKGHSKVAYKGESYTKYSGYSESCFIGGEEIKDFKKTLRLMKDHDGAWLIPTEIHYGLFFRRKIKL